VETREPATIYVRLLDEAVDVWRPVSAWALGGDVYRVADQPVTYTETWEFGPGTDVVCRMAALSEGTVLTAITLP
jgi:hypothetical protein